MTGYTFYIKYVRMCIEKNWKYAQTLYTYRLLLEALIVCIMY